MPSLTNPVGSTLSTLAGIEEVENLRGRNDLRRAQADQIRNRTQQSSQLTQLTGLAQQGNENAILSLFQADPERARAVMLPMRNQTLQLDNVLAGIADLPLEERFAAFEQVLPTLGADSGMAELMLARAADDDGLTDEDIASFRGQVTQPGLEFFSLFDEPEAFSGTTRAIDEQGNPVLLERGSRSGVRPIENFSPPPQSGETIEVGPDGTVSIRRGANAPASSISKPTRTAIEKELIELGDTMSQLNMIDQSLRPEFAEIGSRFQAAFTAGKAKLGIDIDPQDRAQLEQFAAWRADARNLQATVINALSGAAVSEAEAERLNGFLINPGKGLFDGDDAITIEVKKRRLRESTTRAIARRNFFLNSGIALTDEEFNRVPLETMPAIIDRRGAEVMNEFTAQNPEMPAGEVRAAAMSQLRSEFGI